MNIRVQELEEEPKENNMKWDVIGLGEVRSKEEFFTTLQSGHLLFQSSRTIPTHNRQIPTEDRSSICANDISLR